MIPSNVRKALISTIAVAALACIAAVPQLGAASPDMGAKVTFTAQGTFSAVPISGEDSLKLSGQPFTITVVGQSSDTPVKHGRNWAIFKPLTMTGTVYSGLVPNEPIPIQANTVELEQTAGASEDIFTCTFPVQVIGIDLNVVAKIVLPGGTLGKPLIRPFPTVAIDTTNSSITYSNSTAATVLGVADGATLGAVVASVSPR